MNNFEMALVDDLAKHACISAIETIEAVCENAPFHLHGAVQLRTSQLMLESIGHSLKQNERPITYKFLFARFALQNFLGRL